MAAKINDVIRARYDLLTKTVDALEKKIKSFPEGSIKVKKTDYGVYYCLKLADKTDRHLTYEDNDLIKQLIQKSYLKEALTAARKEKHALGKIVNNYPKQTLEDIYSTLSDERKEYASPIIPGDAESANKWLATPNFGRNLISIETEFYTLNGEHVRSKSEVIIADRLYAKGIPYKYECPLQIGNRIIHPDFTILRLSDRKIIYHEHCGMMDDPNYAKDMVNRINLYSTADIYLGDRLFFTLESSETPLDIRLLDELIEKHFR